ncbi:hypothetical protein HCU40_04855 [Pseudanabaena biceps]|nr:hypothetical protein [Pseudanabaena biceps]
MIWIVIILQLIISTGLLYASWQVWLLKRSLSATVLTVDGWTEACENGLQGSNPGLEIAREGVGSARKQYQTLQNQLAKIRNLLSFLARGVSFVSSRWQQSRKSSSRTSANSSTKKSSGIKQNVKRRR